MLLCKLFFTPKYLYGDSGISLHIEAIVSDFTNANTNCIHEALGIKVLLLSIEWDPSFYFNKCLASFPGNILVCCIN